MNFRLGFSKAEFFSTKPIIIMDCHVGKYKPTQGSMYAFTE